MNKGPNTRADSVTSTVSAGAMRRIRLAKKTLMLELRSALATTRKPLSAKNTPTRA